MDLDFRFTYISPSVSRALGYRVGELMSLTMQDIMTPGSFGTAAEVFAEKFHQVQNELGTPEIITMELELKCKNSATLWTEVKASLLRGPDGQPVGVVSVARDITQRRKADQKEREVDVLKEMDQLRGKLLADISHELRTPLASIKGFVSTLLRTDVSWSQAEQQDFLRTIGEETERLNRLISDILDMSRVDAGALRLTREYHQVSGIIESAMGRLSVLAKNHQLRTVVPPGIPLVFADEMRIGQVLTNLVENAAKHSLEGTEITIEAKHRGNEVMISVTDRGEGIPAELIPKLFDRFYQVEVIATGRKGGTGLGLSICSGILKTHGGRIWVKSELGKGSEFSFALPVSDEEEAQIVQDTGH